MVADPPTTCRVAICDDVADFRRIIALMLDLEPGIEVVGQAEDGRGAVELVADHDVDVLLLDVAMPVMDGLEALPLVVDRSPATKVILLTGFGTDRIRARGMELGAFAYLEKGISPGALVDAVRTAHGATVPER